MACHAVEARLIHISTDYVFGNGGTTPYTEYDREAPLSTYGASKLAGEHLIAASCEDYAIVRSSGLYGHAPCLAKGGKNFVQLMLQLASERSEVKVVTDEGWFAARPSGTEDIYKIYAESFNGEEHLRQIQQEARAIVQAALD